MAQTCHFSFRFKTPWLYEQFHKLAVREPEADWGAFAQFLTFADRPPHAMSGDWRARWSITRFMPLPREYRADLTSSARSPEEFLAALVADFPDFKFADLDWIWPDIAEAGTWPAGGLARRVSAHANPGAYDDVWDRVMQMPSWLKPPAKVSGANPAFFFSVEMPTVVQRNIYAAPGSKLGAPGALVRGVWAFQSSLHQLPIRLGDLVVVKGPFSLARGPAPAVEELVVLIDESHLAASSALAPMR